MHRILERAGEVVRVELAPPPAQVVGQSRRGRDPDIGADECLLEGIERLFDRTGSEHLADVAVQKVAGLAHTATEASAEPVRRLLLVLGWRLEGDELAGWTGPHLGVRRAVDARVGLFG